MASCQGRIARPGREWQRRRGSKPTPNARRADLHPAAAAAGRAGRRAATSSAAIPRQAVRRPALCPIPVRAASRAAASARLRARSRRIFPAAVDQPAACRTVKQLAFACFVASVRLDLNFGPATASRALERCVFNGSFGRSLRLTRNDLRATLNPLNPVAPRAPQSANFREVSCPVNHA
jgi:hypothetical protein